jgi:HK97 family phage prohead protease
MIFSETVLVTRHADGADGGLFDGLASSWTKDRHGDQIAPGAFVESIAALAAGQRRVPLLLNHDTSEQLGGIKTAAETDLGLRVQGQIVRGTPAADRVHDLSKAGQMGLSVGFLPVAGATESMDGGGTLYKRVDLVEVSAVATPSNRESRVLTIKSLAESSPAEFACLLRDGELPPMPRRLAEKVARACLAAINETDTDEPTAEELAAIASALERLKLSFKPRKMTYGS